MLRGVEKSGKEYNTIIYQRWLHIDSMADTQAAKRRRTSSPGNRNDGVSLSDLPNEALSYAASSFLARPSRAIFTIAFGGDDELSKAIIGERRDVLNFSEIERRLAARNLGIYQCQYQSEKIEARGMRQYYRCWVGSSSWISCFGAD